MKVEIVFVKGRRVLMLNKVLPDGRYYTKDSFQIATTNPTKTVSDLIVQFQEFLKLSKEFSGDKRNENPKDP